MSKKEEFFKERFKQALDSTYKVISEELNNLSKKENPKNIEDYKISNLYSREDYIKFRALNDSNACLLYTSPSPRDNRVSRMPSSA